MRVEIHFDSATTKQVRSLALALHLAGLEGPTVKVEGPECWQGRTPKMAPNAFAAVVGQLVTFEGTPIASVLS